MRLVITLLAIVLLWGCSTTNNQQTSDTGPADTLPPAPKMEIQLDKEQASQLSGLALGCIGKQYPNKLGQVLGDASDLGEPEALHPAFYGCFDWHSAVHGHWSLVRLLKRFPDLPNADEIRARLDANLTAENIKKEAAFFEGKYNENYERTYGWAWLLKLVEELEGWDDPQGKKWREALRPLEELLVQRFIEFLPKLNYPIRVGEHTNTAFALSLAWDYTEAVDKWELQQLIEFRAREFYLKDKACPLSWEPSGFDFLSPCLEEAGIMSRVLDEKEFQDWFGAFLPSWKNIEPAEVSDRTDPKLVHLDGLNFSRAWILYGLAEKLPKQKEALKRYAEIHMAKSLPKITSGDYAGEHWLASFALYALSAKSQLEEAK